MPFAATAVVVAAADIIGCYCCYTQAGFGWRLFGVDIVQGS